MFASNSKLSRWSKHMAWWFFDFSGLRWICVKIYPPAKGNHDRPPSSFVIWIAGVYIALVGLSSGLYNQEFQNLNGRIDFLYSTLEDENRRYVLNSISKIQSEEIPVSPELKLWTGWLTTPFRGIFAREQSPGIIEKVTNVFELEKANLRDLDVTGLNLTNADLASSDWNGSKIADGNFSSANLSSAIFSNSHIIEVNFGESNINRADFSKSILESVNFFKLGETGTVNFSDSIFRNVNMEIEFQRPTYVNDTPGVFIKPYNPPFNNIYTGSIIYNSNLIFKNYGGSGYGCLITDSKCREISPGISAPIMESSIEVSSEFSSKFDFGRLCITETAFDRLKAKLENKFGYQSYYGKDMQYHPTCGVIPIYLPPHESLWIDYLFSVRVVNFVIDMLTNSSCDAKLEAHIDSRERYSYFGAQRRADLLDELEAFVEAKLKDGGAIENRFTSANETNRESFRAVDDESPIWQGNKVEVRLTCSL